MILGIILFIVAIAGTIFGIASSITVGDLQSKVGLTGEDAIFDEGSDVTNKTLWEIGTTAIGDAGNIPNMSLNEIAEKYGLTTKLNKLGTIIDGIDFSPIFDVPINEIGSSIHLIVEGITLNDVGTLAGIDFSSYDIPVIKDNLYNSVTKAVDEILSGIADSNNLTLRQIEDNFGLTLGENAIFTQIKDSPLSSFGSIVNGLEVGTIIDADCDLFILNGANPVYVKVDRYEQVTPEEIDLVKDGAKTYVAGADDDGNLTYKELRFVVKTAIDENGDESEVKDESGNLLYKVDNSCYTPDEDNDKTYYRLVEYEKANTENLTSSANLYVRAYSNHFVKNADNSYSPAESDFIALDTLTIAGTAGASVIVTSADKYLDGENLVNMEVYGKDPEEYPSESTRLIAGGDESYLLVHKGTSDTAIQAIARTTVKGLNGATDSLMSLRLGDLIEITADSATILVTLQNTPLNALSGQIDSLTLGDVIEIIPSAYVPDDNGIYVYVSQQAEYVVADSSYNGTKYVASFVENADGKYVAIGGNYYIYDKDNADMNGLTRYDKVYSEATAENASAVKYQRIDKGGYYTLYNPDLHDGMKKYSKVTDKADDVNPDYILATEEQIENDGIVKFYWDGSEMQTSVIDGAQAYVKGSASSKVLQRLASVGIGDFSDAFSGLILGDVLDVETDVYVTATLPYAQGKDYYYFENDAYRLADVFDSTFLSEHPDAVIYEIAIEGASNAVLKKLAYTKIDDMAAQMDTVIDDMRLNEVVDITLDLYMPVENGKYVYDSEGYYTLYNPAVHDENATRYEKIKGVKEDGEGGTIEFSYIEATAEQLADVSIVKYFWNGSEMQTSPVDSAKAYVEGTASSSTLQRFAKVKIGDFSASFDKVILSDVIAIDGDLYEKANAIEKFVEAADTTNEDETYYVLNAGNYEKTTRDYIDAHPDETYYAFEGGNYYRYSDGVYLESTPAFIGSHVTEQYYALVSAGTTHAVLRKMAYLPVNDLGAKMDVVINDMYLKDLIGINEFDEVKHSNIADDDENARWLVEADDNYTIVQNGKTYRYAFVYDENGKYYLRSDVYLKLTAEQLAKFELGTISYGYTKFTSADAMSFATEAALHPYMYYSATGEEFTLNPALATYLAAKNKFEKTYYRDSEKSDFTATTYQNYMYNGNAMLYVSFGGSYVPYDATNPAHADMDIYIHLTDGYYPQENGEYRFDGNAGEFVIGSTTTLDLAFTKLPVRNLGGEDLYYFAKLDADYNAKKEAGNKPIIFSKQLCEEVFLQDEDGEYTYFDGEYVLKSSLPAGAEGEGSFTKKIAYIANVAENCLIGESGYVKHISTEKVEIVKAKSAHVIKAFATHDVKVGSLDDAMKTFTVSDLMSIEPDSLFDDADIKDATLDDLGNIFQSKLQNMTISDLLDWGNITSLKPEVLSIIGDVRLEQFFGALTYDKVTGITVDLEKLFS